MANAHAEFASRIVRGHLEAGIVDLERRASEGGYGQREIQDLGNAARVLGHQDIADRAIRLLEVAPEDNSFWVNAITNIPLSARKARGKWTLTEMAELEKRYPLFSADRIIERIRSSGNRDKHLRLCLQGKHQEACNHAKSGLKLEEVGVTLAVLGEFAAAQSIADDPALENVRRGGVRYVLRIEWFRHGHLDEIRDWLAEHESKNLDASAHAQLALALGGREPWSGYPYPDW
jgi:hypothetical protein